MIPVRTRASNFVYRGPSPDIGDAWVERRWTEHAVLMTWQPSPEERAAIAAGALVELGIYNVSPIPPVSLNVSPHRALDEIGARIRERARTIARRISPASQSLPPGWWVVGAGTWRDLNEHEALDPSDGVPTLLGRPLMVGDLLADDDLDYVFGR